VRRILVFGYIVPEDTLLILNETWMSTDRYLQIASAPSLQLLLFLDERPNSPIQNQQIRDRLFQLQKDYQFELQVIDVTKQPDLTEYYRILATPALVKLSPLPRQTLAGSNLVTQIGKWWDIWQREVSDQSEEMLTNSGDYPIASAEGNVLPLSDSVAYIRKLIELNDQILSQKQEQESLKERLKLQDRAMAMLAHDLRNPLTAASLALGTLEIISNPQDDRSRFLDPKTVKKLIGQAQSQLHAIERLVQDILEPLRSKDTDLYLRPQQLDLSAIVTDVLQQMSEQWQLKCQTLIADIPPDIPPVYADEERVRQVIVNLLDNAIKYTPTNGNIRISLLHRTTQNVQFTISDDGPGIPEENQKNIFQDRYRLDRDASQSGYGLGLGVCERIIHAHYGQIWVESTSGRGTSFNFTLLVYPN
jgi:two-component system clock-associated histidine kinase SasA